jgi:hypothetical protein
MQWSFAFWRPGAGAVTVSYAAEEPANDASTKPSSSETDRNERLGSKCLPVGPESRAIHEQAWTGKVHQEQAKVAPTVLLCNGMGHETLTVFRPDAMARVETPT